MHYSRARTIIAPRLVWKGGPGRHPGIPSSPSPGKQGERGFSLIEYLFAIFLTFITAMIVVATLPMATSARARADRHHRALNIAQKQLESIKALGYSQVSPAGLHQAGLVDSPIPDGAGRLWFTHIDSSQFDAPSQVLPGGRGYVVLTTLQIDLIQITVVVDWQERSGTRQVMLSTHMANK